MQLQDHRRRLRPAAMARQCPEAFMLRPGQMIRADPAAQVAPARVGQVDPADLGNTVRADPADLPVGPADLAVPADLGNTVRADPADLPAVPAARADLDTQAAPVSMVRVDLVVPADQAGPVGPADPAVLGTAILSVATSTEPRGEKDPLRGATASHPARTGEGRSRRPADVGTMARSTTGATKKHPSGIPDSTSGASTSSESGSRCK
jgi:hypothetical protein